MIVVTGLILGLAMFALAPVLIRLMGAEGNLADLAVQYLRVYSLCSPVTTIVFAMDNYFKICGRIRTSMTLNIVMSVLSAVLEFIFLFVFGWGIWAAALATCASMFLCALAALYPFARGKMQLKFTTSRLDWKMIKTIISCGSPNFLNNVAGRITSIVMNVILLQIGGAAAVSVYGILMFADGFVQPLLYGMCDSLQPAVGYNWGAGSYRRVRAIEQCCFTASAILSIGSALLLFAFPAFITRLFLPQGSAEFMAVSFAAIRLFSLTYLTRWLSFATQSCMLAIGSPLPASLLSVSNALIFPVILVVVLGPLELTGLWLNFPGTSALTSVLAFGVLIRFGRDLKRLEKK